MSFDIRRLAHGQSLKTSTQPPKREGFGFIRGVVVGFLMGLTAAWLMGWTP